MDLSAIDVLTATRDVGSTGLLALAVVGGFRRWYVWGWAYDAVVRERDEWKSTALKALHVAEHITTTTP